MYSSGLAVENVRACHHKRGRTTVLEWQRKLANTHVCKEMATTSVPTTRFARSSLLDPLRTGRHDLEGLRGRTDRL